MLLLGCNCLRDNKEREREQRKGVLALFSREAPLRFTVCAGVPLEFYFKKEKGRGIPTKKKKNRNNLDTTVAEHELNLIQ